MGDGADEALVLGIWVGEIVAREGMASRFVRLEGVANVDIELSDMSIEHSRARIGLDGGTLESLRTIFLPLISRPLMDVLTQPTMRLHLRARCSSRLSFAWLWRIASCVPNMAGQLESAKSIDRTIRSSGRSKRRERGWSGGKRWPMCCVRTKERIAFVYVGESHDQRQVAGQGDGGLGSGVIA